MYILERPNQNLSRFIDQMADRILMETIYGGDISSVTSEERDSEAYLHCQNAAARILGELFERTREYGYGWDEISGKNVEEFNQVKEPGDAKYHADEYWAKPLQRDSFTAKTDFFDLKDSEIEEYYQNRRPAYEASDL